VQALQDLRLRVDGILRSPGPSQQAAGIAAADPVFRMKEKTVSKRNCLILAVTSLVVCGCCIVIGQYIASAVMGVTALATVAVFLLGRRRDSRRPAGQRADDGPS
jgi:uncharacterized membrane protein YfcA